MPPRDDVHFGCPEVFWRVVRLLEREYDDFPPEQFEIPGQVVVELEQNASPDNGDSGDESIYTQEDMGYLSDFEGDDFEFIDLTCDETDSDDDTPL